MIWLVGGNGMMGRDLAEKLSAAGTAYLSTDIELDITDKLAVTEFSRGKNSGWIINCSAYTAVDRAEDEKEKAFAVNCDGVKNLAEAAKSMGAKIIHLSTDYVFSGLKERGYTEDDKASPSSVYGASKLAGEDNLSSSHDKYFIFRISWLYGAYGKNFVHTMLNLFNERDELNVVNDQFGSPTYTGELAEFLVNLVQSGSDKYGIYHFSGEGMINWHEFASEIYRFAVKYRLTERMVKINPVDSSKYPQKAKRPAYSYMFKDKLYSTFGYRPKNWRETLEEYIKSIKV